MSDTEAEGPETFHLNLTPAPDSPIALALTADSGTGTINDTNDRIVSLNVYGASALPEPSRTVQEGLNVEVEVRLNAPSSEDVTGTVELVDGTAKFRNDCGARENGPVDFAIFDDYFNLNPRATGNYKRPGDYQYEAHRGVASREWTIAAGETSASMWLTIFEDGIYEPSEKFQVRLGSDLTGAQAATDKAVSITIEDRDQPPTLSINDAAAREGQDAVFILSYQRGNQHGWGQQCAVSIPATVELNTADGSALAGTHYEAVTNHTETLVDADVALPPSQFEVATLADGESSGDRVFTVVLSNPVNAVIGRGVGRGRVIEDDCVDPTVAGFAPPALRLASASAEEGEAMRFTVSVNKPFCRDVARAVTVTAALGTAGAGDALTPPGVVGFKAGETSAVFSGVRTIEDSLDEDAETVVATARWHAALGVGDAYESVEVSATGEIEDDDPEPSLEILDATAAEGDNLVFLVELSVPSGREVTVRYKTRLLAGDRAAAAGDYTADSATLTFAAGETAKQVVVASVEDAVDEHDEQFQVELFDATNADIDDSIGVGTIEDDDPLPTAKIASTEAGEDANLRFTVTLFPVSGRDATVVYTTATTGEGDGHAVAGDDYTAKTATAIIPAGHDTTTIEIEVDDDAADEPDETLAVKLIAVNDDNTLQTTHTTISTTEHTATATIKDND